jgi:hypothetical protein
MKTPRYVIGIEVLAAVIAAATLAARYLPRGHASEYRVPRPASPGEFYESLANGRQPYPNPDRQLYLPD